MHICKFPFGFTMVAMLLTHSVTSFTFCMMSSFSIRGISYLSYDLRVTGTFLGECRTGSMFWSILI